MGTELVIFGLALLISKTNQVDVVSLNVIVQVKPRLCGRGKRLFVSERGIRTILDGRKGSLPSSVDYRAIQSENDR